MSTTVRGNDTVHFIFFFIMRLNITIIASSDSLIVTLVTIFSSLKLKNRLKKHAQNVARIKQGFVELVVIRFTLNKYVTNLLLLEILSSAVKASMIPPSKSIWNILASH